MARSITKQIGAVYKGLFDEGLDGDLLDEVTKYAALKIIDSELEVDTDE
jgi:hypothetical protein